MGEFQSLSPDGMLLLQAAGNRVCLQAVDGPDVDCLHWREDDARARLAAAWSPNSAAVAFYDRITQATTFMSPVYRLSVELGTVSEVIEGDDTFPIDLALSIDTLAFLGRLAGQQEFGVSLLPRSGGMELLAELPGGLIEWLPDDSALLFTGTGTDAPGLWRVDAIDGSRSLIAPFDAALGHPLLAGISNNGKWALIVYTNALTLEAPAGVSHYGLVELETGEVTPLKASSEQNFFGPVAAAFSPESPAIAYAYHSGTDRDAPLTLVTRSLRGGKEDVVGADLESDIGAAPSQHFLIFDPNLTPVWRSDGFLVLPTAGWALIVDLFA